MSKKKWLLLTIVAILLGSLVYYVYRQNMIPQFTSLVNIGLNYLQGGFNANPWGIVGAVGGTVTGISTAAKLMWDRTKSGLQDSYGSIIGDKDEQLTNLSNQFTTVKTEAATLQGQLKATQSELETTKATLTATKNELADALTEIRRRQDEINATANVKATELKMANSVVTIDSVLHELGSNVDPAAAARILTGKGITVTVP